MQFMKSMRRSSMQRRQQSEQRRSITVKMAASFVQHVSSQPSL